MNMFLSSERVLWGMLDSWLNQGHPLGVFTVLADHARGEGSLAEVKGDHPGAWGLAVVDRVTGEPADRLHEALKQSKRRQLERLREANQPIQIRPLTNPLRGRLPAQPMTATSARPATSRTTSTPRCTRSPDTPRTATAKAAGFACTASVAPSGRCGLTTPRLWGSSPSLVHPWRCWSTP